MRVSLLTHALRALLVAAIAASAGCGGAKEQPLRLGSNLWVGYELFFVARNAGFYAGDNIKLVELRSAAQVINALQSGTINAAGLTLDEALQVVDAGVPIEVVGILDYSTGADALVAAPHIADAEALRGKRIAVETSTVGAYLLRRFLQASGLTLADVTVVPVSNSEHEAALSQKHAEAAITFEPMLTRLKAMGYRTLYSSAQIPGEIADVLVVLRGERAPSPATVRQLLDGFYRARTMLKTDPERFAALAQHRLKMPEQDIRTSYESITIPDLREAAEMMQPRGIMARQLVQLGVYLSDSGRIAGACDCRDLINDDFVVDLSRKGAAE